MKRRIVAAAGFAALLVPSAAFAAEGLVDVPKIVNFTILAAILGYALRKPLAAFLQAKTEQIRRQNEQVANWTRDSAELRGRAETRTASLGGEEAATLARIREAAVEEAGRIVAEAEAQAAQISEQAQRELEARVRAAEDALRRSSAQAAARIARERIRKEITDEDRNRLFDAGLDAIRAK